MKGKKESGLHHQQGTELDPGRAVLNKTVHGSFSPNIEPLQENCCPGIAGYRARLDVNEGRMAQGFGGQLSGQPPAVQTLALPLTGCVTCTRSFPVPQFPHL